MSRDLATHRQDFSCGICLDLSFHKPCLFIETPCKLVAHPCREFYGTLSTALFANSSCYMRSG